MKEFRSVLREGLARQNAAAGSHPDPDILTAFMEQALSQPERQGVLQHLAVCIDCRDVLALALPEGEPLPALAAARGESETSIWKRWLVVRWAAAAAAVLVIAGSATMYRSLNPTHQMAKIVDGPAYLASREVASANAPAPQTAARTEANKNKDRTEANKNIAEPGTNPAEAAHASRTGSRDLVAQQIAVRKPAEPTISGQQPATMAKAMSPAAPPPVNTVASSAGVQPNQVPAALVDSPTSVPGMMTAENVSGPGFGAPNGRALMATSEAPVLVFNEEPELNSGFAPPRSRNRSFAPGFSKRAPIGSSGLFANDAAPDAPVPSLHRRWSVGSDGQLLHSHGGQQWHTVHVGSAVVFTAVGEAGSEVWAGGVGGALYHSIDNGNTWMRIVPVAGDQPLNADITHIATTRHASADILTSTGQHWITVDGGQHWVRHQ